jgi:hypothetical protein
VRESGKYVNCPRNSNDESNIETAQFEGNIETVYVAKMTEGYGLISLSRITVAGE